MVVGNGLLASTFTDFNTDDSVIVFASGVSNSLQRDEAEYHREFDLLKKHSLSSSLFIYFSTCSVFDKTLEKSPYIQHKLKLEKFTKENFSSFIIFRLPILVGNTSNPHTLTNYIYNKIKSKQKFTVFKNACRYLMDVEDVRALLSEIIYSNDYKNKVLNIHFGNRVFIPDLINLFEQTMRMKAWYEIEEKGDCCSPDNRIFSEFLQRKNFSLPQDYIRKTINKYYGDKN